MQHPADKFERRFRICSPFVPGENIEEGDTRKSSFTVLKFSSGSSLSLSCVAAVSLWQYVILRQANSDCLPGRLRGLYYLITELRIYTGESKAQGLT